MQRWMAQIDERRFEEPQRLARYQFQRPVLLRHWCNSNTPNCQCGTLGASPGWRTISIHHRAIGVTATCVASNHTSPGQHWHSAPFQLPPWPRQKGIALVKRPMSVRLRPEAHFIRHSLRGVISQHSTL